MTNKEMAAEWADSQMMRFIKEQIPPGDFAMEAYLAGLEAGEKLGLEKGIKAKINTTTISDCPIKNEWHDLQKAPNNLPEETEFIESDVLLLLVQLKGTEHKRYELGRYNFSANVFSYTHLKSVEDVVAWCEIPRFEEE